MNEFAGYIHAGVRPGALVPVAGQREDGRLEVDAPATSGRARLDGPAPARVMFIDAAVHDGATLLDGLQADATAYVLDPTRDGLQQIGAILASHQNLQAVAIFAHGIPGKVALGSGCLDQEGLARHQASLRSIGRAIAPGGVVQLAACEAGRGREGHALIRALSQQIGAAVAASSQRLGGADGGGNWTLDVATSTAAAVAALPIAAAVLQSYAHALGGAAAPPAGFPLDITDFSAPVASGGSFVDGGSAIVNGTALQLTPNVLDMAGIAVYNQAFSSGLGLSFQFSYNSSGGTGADGISFFLLNGDAVTSAAAVTPGAYGGGLGYSNDNMGGTGGITGGFLGVGFDTHGNYAQTDQGQTSSGIGFGPASTANYVGVRGAYNAATPFGWITGAPYAPGIDGTRNVQVNVQNIDATHEQLQVYMEPLGSSTYTEVINTTINQALPSQFYFGFAASTGGSSDLHLINSVSVQLPTSLILGTATVEDVTTSQANPATLNPGDTFTYTYSLTNNGPNDDGEIAVNDQLPANITGQTWTVQDSAGTHGGSGSAISANLLNGAAATITVTARVAPDSTSGNADHTIMLSPGAAYSLVDPNEATGTLDIGGGGSSVSLVGANQTVTTTDVAAVAPFADASVVDTYVTPDTGAPPVDTMTAQAAPAAGTLSGTGATYDASTGTLTATGTADQLQTVLRSITFTPTAHAMAPGATAPVSISVTVTDSANSATATQAATATVTASHDTPMITGAAANQAVNDNATVAPFSSLAVTDPDLTGATLAVTVVDGSVDGGFTTASAAGWTRSAAPNGDLTYTLGLGTQSDIGAAAQAALRSLVFQPAPLTSLRGAHATVHFAVSVADTATPAAGATDTGSSVLVSDVTPPAAPVSLALAPASDSGIVGDDVTSVALATITGAAEPGSTVKLYDADALIGTGTANPTTGVWAVAAGVPLTQGLNSLTATATDAAGNTSAPSSALAVTLDALVPAAPANLLLAPASDSGTLGDDLTNHTRPAINGTGAAGDSVTLYDGAAAIGMGTVASNGTWSITPSAALADGLHSLTATQASVAGKVSPVSAALPLTIDTVAPAAPTFAVSAASTDPAEPVVGGLAETGSLVRLYQDGAGAPIGSATASAGGWAFVYPSALAAGHHTLTATATDRAGNVSPVATPLALVVNADQSYTVATPASGSDTKSFAYDSGGALATVQTLTGQGQVLVSVSGTAALMNIYDTAGTLIGTLTQPSTSAFSLPVYTTTPTLLGALTDSGPTGSVVDLLSENNSLVSAGNDTITTQSGTPTITATGAATVVDNLGADLTFYGRTGVAAVYGGSGTVTAVGGSGGGTLTGGAAGNNVLAAGGGTTTVVGVADGDTLFGSNNGTDTLFAADRAGIGGETLVGGAGNETLIAHSGDVAFGGAGHSTLFSGKDGGSTLVGGSGTSVLVADGGSENMYGGSGTSTLWAGSGPDVMTGNASISSTTVMNGGTGNDVFVGSNGVSTASGGSGNDTFWSGAGAMRIVEGSGNNLVAFGNGLTTVMGGMGTDVYLFINGQAGGTDVISNFKVGVDQINLSGYQAAAVQQQVSGGGTLLSLADHTSVLLAGVTQLAPNSIVQG